MRYLKLLNLVLLAGAPMLAPLPASAQEIETVTSTGVLTGSLGLTGRQDTGSRLGLTPMQTPASVQVISGEAIRAMGDINVIQAQTRAPGFATSAAPGNGNSSVSVRGFNGVNSVMQLYNGTQLYVGSGTVTFPFDAWTVDRIEILSGPASVMYGSGAIGGVINVVSRKPSRMESGEARIAYGSDNTARAAIDITGPVGDGGAYRLDVSKNISSGWVDRGAHDNLAASAALSWQLTPDLVVTVADDYGEQHPMRYFGTPLIGGVLNESLRHANFNVGDANMRFQDNWARIEAEWTPLSGLEARNTVYYLTSDRHYKDVENYTYSTATQLVTRSSYIEIYHHESQIGDHGDVSFASEIAGMANKAVLGFDVNAVRFQHVNDSPYGGTSTVNPTNFLPGSFINLTGTFPRFRTYTQQFSVFAEDRLEITPALSITGGLRDDNYVLQYGDLVTNAKGHKDYHGFSWRVGAVYEAAPGLMAYGQYSTATDPVSSLITLSPAQQGFDLTTGRQVEIGLKRSFWDGRGEWTLAAYDIVKKKLLAPDPITPTIQQQIGKQSSRGIEVSTALDLGGGWSLQANAAILQARFDDFYELVSGVRTSRIGKRPPNVPTQTANLWLGWDVASDLHLLAGVRYVGSRFANNANTIKVPAYAVLDASVSWDFAPGYAADFRLNNINDEIYPSAQGNAGNQWLLGRPRSAEIALRANF